MQKIEIVNGLKIISERLLSSPIVNLFNTGFATPKSGFDYSQITPILFQSKSSFDHLSLNPEYSKILEYLNCNRIYENSNLAVLSKVFSTMNLNSIFESAPAVAFYTCHATIVRMATLSRDLLLEKELLQSINEEMDNGIIIFQVIIQTEGIPTESYIKIFTLLNELIETIAKIENETDQKSEVILLDSGSDSNIGIKTGIETAKSIFQLFKEVWDFIANHRYYKSGKKNEAILESLEIYEKIQKSVESGGITEVEAQHLKHNIKTRTDDLIKLKVMPKKIVSENKSVGTRTLLSELEEVKFLTAGSPEVEE